MAKKRVTKAGPKRAKTERSSEDGNKSAAASGSTAKSAAESAAKSAARAPKKPTRKAAKKAETRPPIRVGIDLGTTRTVVAVADRGNYPIVSFENHLGDAQGWFPALIAARDGVLRFGFDAEALAHSSTAADWHYVRSIKRMLSDAAPETPITIGDRGYALGDLLVGYLTALRAALISHSNLEIGEKDTIAAWVSVPANANSNQRFLTVEAFRAAGFVVDGVLNEPSAAGIEFVERFGERALGKKSSIAVYDLGGGTFDVSIISVENDRYEVVASEGIRELGGSDFDEALLGIALDEANVDRPVDNASLYYLLEECRERKEGLHPNTRKIIVDLGRGIAGGSDVIVKTKRYDAALAPLIEQTMDALDRALARTDPESLGAVYLVGGASSIPAAGRLVKKRFGRRVRRSPYPHAATAVGLAVASAREAEVTVRERFTRNFGVWREADGGQRIVFDPIFEKDTALPGANEQPLTHRRRYRPAHNIGHFRYLECGGVDEDSSPSGDMNPWDDIYFPMDPALREAELTSDTAIVASPVASEQVIEEEYVCDATGTIAVTIRNETAGYEKTFRLRRV